MNYEDYQLYRINENKTLKLMCHSFFYNTTHSIPESIAIALHTPDGVIVCVLTLTLIKMHQLVIKLHLKDYRFRKAKCTIVDG